MMSEKNFLLILLIATLFSCKNIKHAPPQIERCIHNDDNSAECADLRKKEKQYTSKKLENYICTSPSDEQIMFEYVFNLRKKLIECESRI
jgi:hypothetical protein